MKLARYRFADGIGIGAVVDETIVDLRGVAGTDMRGFLERGPEGLSAAATALGEAMRFPLEPRALLAPIPDPAAFIGVGLNYRAHAAQMGRSLPDRPAIFMKPASAIASPFAAVLRDPAAPSLDYEGELGIVIGRRCRRIAVADAAAFIAGYIVVNDVTVRARVSPDTVIWAKGGLGHAPIGPWLVTPDEVGDPHSLLIRTWVNGALRQKASTGDLHFDCFALVAWLSEGLTLLPGDIIATGSPAGTGAGMNPPRFLEPGDCIRIEIEKVGAIEQVVEDEL